jgi:hypothetical protein
MPALGSSATAKVVIVWRLQTQMKGSWREKKMNPSTTSFYTVGST